jgi:hypothetical protein
MRCGRVSASLIVVVGLALTGSAGCSSSPAAQDDTSSSPPTSDVSAARPHVLETGKGDLALAADTYSSPEGFTPPLQFTVTGDGWRSTHRGPDGFDASVPDPTKDAPLVAVVVVTPPEADASSAFDEILQNARSAGSTTRRLSIDLAGVKASAVDVLDGDGPLVTSAEGGISLDAGVGQRSRVAVLEIDGHPMVVTIYVPDNRRWKAGLEAAMPILSSLRPG